MPVTADFRETILKRAKPMTINFVKGCLRKL